LSPTSPSIRGLLKIHKANNPIRPIVNWTGAPAYKLSKDLNKYLVLPFTFNVHSSTH
jgi:hypothetical protein